MPLSAVVIRKRPILFVDDLIVDPLKHIVKRADKTLNLNLKNLQ